MPKLTRALTKRNIKYLTEEELTRLFAVIESPRDRAIFRLAYHRGLRASEVGLLQVADYRADRGRLYVHRLKCGAVDTSGEYILTDAEVKALRSWLKDRGNEAGPIFLSRNGLAISRKMLDVLMKDYCEAAKIHVDKAHFHALRHSCATGLLERGEDIADVQDHLGHANIANTAIYAKITNKRRDGSGKRLKNWKVGK
jgi:site-specific recombinase XerD